MPPIRHRGNCLACVTTPLLTGGDASPSQFRSVEVRFRTPSGCLGKRVRRGVFHACSSPMAVRGAKGNAGQEIQSAALVCRAEARQGIFPQIWCNAGLRPKSLPAGVPRPKTWTATPVRARLSRIPWYGEPRSSDLPESRLDDDLP